MFKLLPSLCLMLAVAGGCRGMPHRPAAPLAANGAPTVASARDQVTIVQFESETPSGVPSPSTTLGSLLARAEANNPAIAEAEARLRALEGEWIQVGLPPNPTVGYVGSEIGNDGGAGQQGTYASQEFVTAGKLARNRAVVAAEMEIARHQLAASRQRVATDVRVAYYRAAVAQRRVEIAGELVRIGTSAADTSRDLLAAGDISRAALLQSEVEQQNARLALQTARNAQTAAWRQLGAVVGQPALPQAPLDDDLNDLPSEAHWETELARLATSSPELRASLADVDRARRALARECVEAVPNIETQASVQYDYSSDDTIAGMQIGVALPLWNKNQGAIRRARAEVTQANRQVDRVKLNIAARLGAAFQEYSDAQVRAVSYRDLILPRARQTLELVQQGYPSEVGYLDLLTAQRVYSQANLAYVDALGELWESWARIEGMLLAGSLSTEPPGGSSG